MTATPTEPTTADAYAALERVAVRSFAGRKRFVTRLRELMPAAGIPADGPLPGTQVVWSLVVGRAGWAEAVVRAAESTD